MSKEIEQTRSQIVQLIKQECVYLEDKLITRPGVKLKIAQSVKVEFPKAKEKKEKAEKAPERPPTLPPKEKKIKIYETIQVSE